MIYRERKTQNQELQLKHQQKKLDTNKAIGYAIIIRQVLYNQKRNAKDAIVFSKRERHSKIKAAI